MLYKFHEYIKEGRITTVSRKIQFLKDFLLYLEDDKFKVEVDCPRKDKYAFSGNEIIVRIEEDIPLSDDFFDRFGTADGGEQLMNRPEIINLLDKMDKIGIKYKSIERFFGDFENRIHIIFDKNSSRAIPKELLS